VAQEIDKSLANPRTALQDEDTTAFGAPTPDPELNRLEPLLGAWEAEDRTLDTFLGPGVPVRSAERFRWLDGGYFLVQHYETSFGEEPIQTGVNYWYYDSQAERFRIIFFSNNGPSPRPEIAMRAASPMERSVSRARHGFSTTWTRTGRSGSTPTPRSRFLGGFKATTAYGSPG
jgi:hypothetical protein